MTNPEINTGPMRLLARMLDALTTAVLLVVWVLPLAALCLILLIVGFDALESDENR